MREWDDAGVLSVGLMLLLLIFALVLMVAAFVSVVVGAVLAVGMAMVLFAPAACKPFIVLFMLIGMLVLIFMLGIGAN